MSRELSRRDVAKSAGRALLASIAFATAGSAASRTGSRRGRATNETDRAKRLEAVHAAYGVSRNEIRFARGDLPHFLDGTVLHGNAVIAVPDGIDPGDAGYDVVVTTDEHRRIVDHARRRYRRRYDVDPRSPSVRRFGDAPLPIAFVDDLYDAVVEGSGALEGDVDVETATGRSRSELRDALTTVGGAAVRGCDSCVDAAEWPSPAPESDGSSTAAPAGGDSSAAEPPSNPRRPPAVSEPTPTADGGELVLYVYTPVESSSLYPDEDVWSASEDAIGRFDDDHLEGDGAEETRVVYVHDVYEPPSTADSFEQLEAFADFAYAAAAEGDDRCADDRNALATLWVDEMKNRGIARQPGHYSVCAKSSTEPFKPDALWTNAGILQHEIGHNFGCYRTAALGHDEDEAHHDWTDLASCVMDYTSQRFTSDFCSHCDDLVSENVTGGNGAD